MLPAAANPMPADAELGEAAQDQRGAAGDALETTTVPSGWRMLPLRGSLHRTQQRWLWEVSPGQATLRKTNCPLPQPGGCSGAGLGKAPNPTVAILSGRWGLVLIY